jgi:hypothetical protein
MYKRIVQKIKEEVKLIYLPKNKGKSTASGFGSGVLAPGSRCTCYLDH